MSRRRRLIIAIITIPIVGLLLLQVFPIQRIRPQFGRYPTPPIVTNIEWSSPEVEALVRMACYDCHSNETRYPWYANIAPVSWLVNKDINNGRHAMNFSENVPTDYSLTDLRWHINNDMPPRFYVLLHPEANLTAEQKDILFAGFEDTLTQASHEGMDMSSD